MRKISYIISQGFLIVVFLVIIVAGLKATISPDPFDSVMIRVFGLVGWVIFFGSLYNHLSNQLTEAERRHKGSSKRF